MDYLNMMRFRDSAQADSNAWGAENTRGLIVENRKLRFVNQAAESLLNLDSLEATCHYVLKTIAAQFSAQRLMVLVNDGDMRSIKFALGAYLCEKQFLSEEIGVEFYPELLEYLSVFEANNKSVKWQDFLPDVNKDKRASPLASSAIFPISHHNQLIGVLMLEVERTNKLSIEENFAITDLCRLAGTKITQLRQFSGFEKTIARLRSTEKLQQALFRIADITHNAYDMQSFYQKIHNIIHSLVYAKMFSICIWNDCSEEFEKAFSTDDNSDEFLVYCEMLAIDCLKSNRSMIYDEVQIRSYFNEKKFSLDCSMPKSWLGVPFGITQERKGIIIVKSYKSMSSFTEKDKEIIIFLTRHIATAMKRRLEDRRIYHQALHDSLTGLANRELFMDRLDHAVNRLSRNEPYRFAVLFLDLDDFKQINDKLGHFAGDELLVAISKAVQCCLRANDTLSRFGGDEFAILLEDISSIKMVEIIATRIIDAVRKPVTISGSIVNSSTSVGISLAEPNLDSITLLKQADSAMYQAKSKGHSLYYIYDEGLRQVQDKLRSMEYEIKKAIEEDCFELYVQPIVNLATKKIDSFEVLTYWQHHRLGLLTASDYLYCVEEKETIKHLDWLIIEKALVNLRKNIDILGKDRMRPISVNISSRLLNDESFTSDLKWLLKDCELDTHFLSLEVKESHLVQNPLEIKQVFADLKGVGIKLLLDDYGTGTTTLNHLNYFCVDGFKVDKTYVANIGMPSEEHRLVNAMVAIARSLQVDVIAEGIETEQQFDAAKRLGINLGQGYYLCNPTPVQEIAQLLQRDSVPNTTY